MGKITAADFVGKIVTDIVEQKGYLGIFFDDNSSIEVESDVESEVGYFTYYNESEDEENDA